MSAGLGSKRKSPRVQDSHGSKRPVYNEKQAYKLLLGDNWLRKERQVSDAAGSQSDEDSDEDSEEDSDEVEDSDSGSDLSKEGAE